MASPREEMVAAGVLRPASSPRPQVRDVERIPAFGPKGEETVLLRETLHKSGRTIEVVHVRRERSRAIAVRTLTADGRVHAVELPGFLVAGVKRALARVKDDGELAHVEGGR